MSSTELHPRLDGLGNARQHWALALSLHLLAAVALGVASDLGLHLSEGVTFVFAIGTPWALLAFSAGRFSAPRWSPITGAAAVLVGLCSYYCWMSFGLGVSWGILSGNGYRGPTWLALGALVGAVAGAIGGLTWSRHRLLADLAWCGTIALPIAEGFLEVGLGSAPLPPAVAVFGGAGLGLCWWAGRAGARAVTLVVSTPIAAALLVLIEVVLQHQALGRLSSVWGQLTVLGLS